MTVSRSNRLDCGPRSQDCIRVVGDRRTACELKLFYRRSLRGFYGLTADDPPKYAKVMPPKEFPNKGVNRLAVLLGFFGALALWILIAAGFEDRPTDFNDWVTVTGKTAAFFLIPFGLVHAIAWVVRGFKQ